MSSVEFAHVHKVYPGDVVAVEDVSFEVADGEFIALLGPSGCGKSSSMRMIAGLEKVSAGQICLDGKEVNNLGPAERNVALAFESYALYSTLTVGDNLAFPLRSRGMPEDEINAQVKQIAASFELTELLDRKPVSLSGGQAQRVSLSRALIRQPNVMLLDEPLSHLDYRLRSTLRARIRHIHDEKGITTVYVTHDQEEAIALADRIIVMNAARIQQIGTVIDLWNRPINQFVAGFLGDPAMNFITGEIVAGVEFKCAAGQVDLGEQLAAAGPHVLGVRPQNVKVSAAADQLIAGKVLVSEFQGEETILTITTGVGDLKAIVPADAGWRSDDTVGVSFPTDYLHIFTETGAMVSHSRSTEVFS